MTSADFHAVCPGAYFLDRHEPEALEDYLRANGRLAPGEKFHLAERAGEGNMNCTVRVRTSAGSFILKQSRPWVEKYPQLQAPENRALVEGRFYEAVARCPAVRDRMPLLLWTDEAARLLAVEDLGAATDFTPLYSRSMVVGDLTLAELAAYLSDLHAIPFTAEERAGLRNQPMRTFNAEHVFHLPLRADNGLDLDAITPGLTAAGAPLKADAAYGKIVRELSGRYVHGEGPSLLHGDFFPGSFLQTDAGLRVIDPEFCFCGDTEYDVGVLLAHLIFSGEAPEWAESLFNHYRPMGEFSRERARQYAGVELMRRLLGVAQLSLLVANLETKMRWLDWSRRYVLEPEKPLRLD